MANRLVEVTNHLRACRKPINEEGQESTGIIQHIIIGLPIRNCDKPSSVRRRNTAYDVAKSPPTSDSISPLLSMSCLCHPISLPIARRDDGAWFDHLADERWSVTPFFPTFLFFSCFGAKTRRKKHTKLESASACTTANYKCPAWTRSNSSWN